MLSGYTLTVRGGHILQVDNCTCIVLISRPVQSLDQRYSVMVTGGKG